MRVTGLNLNRQPTRNKARLPKPGGISRHRLTNISVMPNPGALAAKIYVPAELPQGAPLVVVLHGCTQTAAGYDQGTGWTRLADRHKFAVLYPEQQRANNMNLCFNWFEPGDMQRGAGEPASIKAMIDHMIAGHAIDPARVFVTGLSAGAAMAGVMLATYPDVFAGGGLIAGLPYGSAQSMPDALKRMRGRGRETDIMLADLVRGASDHAGPWPRVSIWHGSSDMTVNATNADATVAQWRAVHELSNVPASTDTVDGHSHYVWRDATGRDCVEEYRITGMGHGTPLDPGDTEGGEVAGAYMLDVGISSTRRIAAFWGIIDEAAPSTVEPVTANEPISQPHRPLILPEGIRPPTGVQEIIENALRSAGLMR